MALEKAIANEEEKFEQRFLDMKMELMMDGWSTRLAMKYSSFKKEAMVFDEFVKAIYAGNKWDQEHGMDGPTVTVEVEE